MSKHGWETENTPNYLLLLVEWQDSYGCRSDWTELDNINTKEHSCFSVGWNVSKSKDFVVLVPHYSGDNPDIGAIESGCGDMTIPMRSVIKMTHLSSTCEQPNNKGDADAN
jgi:hypothetical protein